MSWSPPDSSLSGGLPLISYRVRYNGTELYNISRMQDELEANISRLQPNTRYAISVSASNTLGWGEEALRSITTRPRMRKQFVRVIQVKSKSFVVTVKMSAPHKHLQCDLTPNATFTLTQWQRNETLTDLTPNTQYTIHVWQRMRMVGMCVSSRPSLLQQGRNESCYHHIVMT